VTDRTDPGSQNERPAALGFRWPAEWEPHEATWLSWPHNPETWPDGMAPVERAFCAMAEALQVGERVRIHVLDARHAERVAGLLQDAGVDVDGRVDLYAVPTDDAWVRDHGGIFLVRDADGVRERALLDFRFDAWGGKYPPWERDDAVPAAMARALGVRRFAVPHVLEGGSVDGDGRGTVLTTEQCLLHPNRGAGRTRAGMERLLADTLGARSVVWLGRGIEGDDTDGHVDDLARFVDAGTVVAVEAEPGHPDHPALADNLASLRAARDADGRPLAVATLPMPPPLRGALGPCPASYANFYLANGVALVPVFGVPTDDEALARLRELLPGRRVVGIEARALVAGLGAVHCLTQQEPAASIPAGIERGRNLSTDR